MNDNLKSKLTELDKSQAISIIGDNNNKVSAIGTFFFHCKVPLVLRQHKIRKKTKKVYTDLDFGMFLEDEDFYAGEVLAMETSGSTSTPKLATFTSESVYNTLDNYKKIYNIDDKSIIISTLPAYYNFGFVAGSLLSNHIGCELIFTSPDKLLLDIDNKRLSDEGIRKVFICNPVTIEELAGTLLGIEINNAIFDSGGAALSIRAINWFKEHIGDLREGYGLTETCSLTHFDLESNEQSIGTVGTQLSGVKTKIDNSRGYPEILIKSSNLANRVNNKIIKKGGWYRSGDLGFIDKNNRLKILGRVGDVCIEGLWPRDYLNLIGDVLGFKTALVMTEPGDKVIIKTISTLNPSIQYKVRCLLEDVSPEIVVSFKSDINLSNSIKIKRASKPDKLIEAHSI
ncbi:AMP-binding protein [Pseudoalteromonas piscicida]|uniref:AMP-binding protein n=1 Tax=Pseudoalteromonas piscicida TaxID=43662 RepID=UPI0030CA031A